MLLCGCSTQPTAIVLQGGPAEALRRAKERERETEREREEGEEGREAVDFHSCESVGERPNLRCLRIGRPFEGGSCATR